MTVHRRTLKSQSTSCRPERHEMDAYYGTVELQIQSVGMDLTPHLDAAVAHRTRPGPRFLQLELCGVSPVALVTSAPVPLQTASCSRVLTAQRRQNRCCPYPLLSPRASEMLRTS